MNKFKFLMAILAGVLTLFSMQRVYLAKSDTLEDIYSDIIFTRLAVETQQYTRQIEYGLENGKSLENFYNIQSILADAKKCSSYTVGAYIISSDYTLMYSSADNDAEISEASVPTDDGIFAVLKRDSGYLLSVPIKGKDDALCGYLLLDISNDLIVNAMSEFDGENIVQCTVIGALAYLVELVIIINFCRKKERILSQCALAGAVSIFCAILADAAASVIKLRFTLEGIIQQSVSKITMTLQNDLTTISQKGVSISRIYDLNSWLLESCAKVPFIDNLYYDKSYKIYATVSDDYTQEKIRSYIAGYALMLAICVAGGVLLWVVCRLTDKFQQKDTRRRKNDKTDGSIRDALQELG